MTEMRGAGHIRPWQCAWRCDFGISGMVDPEQAEMLMELYLENGFLRFSDCVKQWLFGASVVTV